jgi:hypothetical protein
MSLLEVKLEVTRQWIVIDEDKQHVPHELETRI